MENIIVGIIVAVAVIWVSRIYYKKFKGKSSCGCSKGSCCGTNKRNEVIEEHSEK